MIASRKRVYTCLPAASACRCSCATECKRCKEPTSSPLLVVLDGPLELLEAGAIAVDVHEGVVAPSQIVVVALGLQGAVRAGSVEVHLDGVAPDGEGGEGLEPVADEPLAHTSS